jgi:serine/threonine-protein kinase HipA
MRQAKILYKDEEAGLLTQHDDASFTFRYHDTWMTDNKKSAISLSLPKWTFATPFGSRKN